MASHIRFLAEAAMVAALYVGLTFMAYALGLDKGAVQLRFAEALCVLPAFTAAAVPGLGVGCLLANLLTACHPVDVLFGTLATLTGAIGCYAMRRALAGRFSCLLLPLPNIVANTLVIPFVLLWAYGVPDGYPFLLLTIGAGEILSAGALGTLLTVALRKRPQLFAGGHRDR